LTNLSDAFLWWFPTLTAALIGLVGIGMVLARRLPVGEGRALTGPVATMAGLVLVIAAGETFWINPSLQVGTAARAERERLIQAEQIWDKDEARLKQELKEVTEQIKALNKEYQETLRRIEMEALEGRTDPKKTTRQLLNELKGDKKASFEARTKASAKKHFGEIKPLQEEESALKRKLQALKRPPAPPVRDTFREYLPLVLPLLTAIFVFGLAWLFAPQHRPVQIASLLKPTPVLPPKDRVPPTAPLAAPGAGQGPPASLPSS
jgi:hypothetical protein